MKVIPRPHPQPVEEGHHADHHDTPVEVDHLEIPLGGRVIVEEEAIGLEALILTALLERCVFVFELGV